MKAQERIWKRKGKLEKKGKLKRKGKKGFALFPILIVISALLVFNIALFNLIKKVNEEKVNIEALRETIDYRLHSSDIFFETALWLSYNNAIYDFSKKFDKDAACVIRMIKDENYFSLKDCNIKREIFLELFENNFQKHLGVYKKIMEKMHDTKFTYSCKFKDEIEIEHGQNTKQNAKIECNFSFDKKANFGFFNAIIIENKTFFKEISLEEIENIEEIIKKLKASAEEIKDKEKKENGDFEDKIVVLKNEAQKNQMDLVIEKCDAKEYINCIYLSLKKRFIIDEKQDLLYTQPKINLIL